MNELDGRQKAAQATYDEFVAKPFALGKADCMRMAQAHCRRMGSPIKGVRIAGSYDSALTMKRALKRLGCKDPGDVIAKQRWPEIIPAEAWCGDIVEIPGEGGMGSLHIVLTNGALGGYHEDAECATAHRPVKYLRAWRVPWRPAK